MKKFFILLLIGVVVVLTGCSIGQNFGSEKLGCKIKGGTWVGGAGDSTPNGWCLMKYSDAGKSCSSSSECQGGCMVDKISQLGKTGTCKKDNDFRGCFGRVEDKVISCRADDLIYNCDGSSQDSKSCQKFHDQTTLANPASVNCKDKGGNLVIQKGPGGGEYGLCFFDDNRACEEWAMMRGDCPVGGVKTTGFDTDAQKYCAWSGGSTLAVPNAICTFSDGSQCSADAFYNGTCQKGEQKNSTSTIGWQTYTNQKLNFTVKYPRDFEAIESNNSVYFESKTQKPSGFGLSIFVKTKTVDQLISELKAADNTPSWSGTEETVMIDGKEAKKINYTPESILPRDTIIYLRGGDKTYVFEQGFGDPIIFNAIVNSFKLLK